MEKSNIYIRGEDLEEAGVKEVEGRSCLIEEEQFEK